MSGRGWLDRDTDPADLDGFPPMVYGPDRKTRAEMLRDEGYEGTEVEMLFAKAAKEGLRTPKVPVVDGTDLDYHPWLQTAQAEAGAPAAPAPTKVPAPTEPTGIYPWGYYIGRYDSGKVWAVARSDNNGIIQALSEDGWHNHPWLLHHFHDGDFDPVTEAQAREAADGRGLTWPGATLDSDSP